MTISKLSKTYGLALFVTLSLWLGSCKFASVDTIYLSGSINEEFVGDLQSKNQKDAMLVINSTGGRASYSLQAARNIIANENTIVINKYCLSSCAEYLLPAAKNVIFKNNPEIGFHWNPVMIESILKQQAPPDAIKYCTFHHSKELSKLQAERGVNNKFWKEVLVRLGKAEFKIEYRPGRCSKSEKHFPVYMWLPNSKQLDDLYGLKFDGHVCADFIKECKSKMDRVYKAGKHIIIGDVLHITK